MGLFDQIAGMAGGLMGGGAQGQGGEGGAATSGGLGAIVQMLESQGGVGAVLGKFQESGLASSWQGQGANAPVSPDQVQSALGSGPIAEVAQKLGIDPQEAAAHISQYLPQIMDHLTPGGHPVDAG